MKGVVALVPLLLAAKLQGQRPASAWSDEIHVGSERELYVRVARLAGSGSLPSWHPWRKVAERAPATAIRILRPSVAAGANVAFPWSVSQPGDWQGKGINARASVGLAGKFWKFSARLEPVAHYASNDPFELENPAAGFVDPVRPGAIDQPQRFGSSALRRMNPGESFVRLDIAGAALGLSHERVFWGPGVRHAILFSAYGPGFPHLFLGTSGPRATPLGTFDGELLYARLDQSEWAPPSVSKTRFGFGLRGAWTPPRVPLQLGLVRFYHRGWPDAFTSRELLAPFGSLFFDEQTFGGGAEDNQLLSLFFSLALSRARMEVFGEFGRNDRSVDVRDLALEAEHNSAWLLGFVKSFAVDSANESLWSVRYEAASGRISAIQSIGRPQATFYEHSPLTQGHTHRGQLLGSPLMDRSGGSELAVDHWNSKGRIGFSLLQRQMPPDLLVGMPDNQARSQWDVRVSTVRFFRGDSEMTVQLGHVWDLNRFERRDVGNLYVGLGWRQGIAW